MHKEEAVFILLDVYLHSKMDINCCIKQMRWIFR